MINVYEATPAAIAIVKFVRYSLYREKAKAQGYETVGEKKYKEMREKIYKIMFGNY